MAAADPTLVQALAATSWTADDGTEQADLTTEAIDDDTSTAINAAAASKIGKGGSPHGDVLRCEFDGFADLAVDDTISIWITGIHNVGTLAMLAYTDADTVTTTDKITVTMATGELVFTLTSGFITALNEIGTDQFAVRFTEDLGISGDFQLAEIDADLTAGNGSVTLTADPGALTLTGAAAVFKTTLAAAAGALILSGAVANFGESVEALPGALQLTGATASLDTTLDAQPGVLTLTGANADFAIGLKLDAQPGALILSGAESGFGVPLLDAQPGALVLTGANASLDTTLDAQPGALILSGAVANFGESVEALPGALLLTGAEALFAGNVLDAQPGALVLTGAVAALSTSLDAAPGALILTGGVANFATGLTLDAQPGTLTLTGAEADLIATGLVVRRGGVRFLLEPDPEIREEKVQELKALIKPQIRPQAAQEPQDTLLDVMDAATSRLTPAQQTRTERLLEETGISMEELLIILSIS